MDDNEYIQYVNGYLQERLHLAQHEASGRHLSELFPDIQRHALGEALQHCRKEGCIDCSAGGDSAFREIHAVRPLGGSAAFRSVICFPFTGPEGESLRAVVFYESFPPDAGNVFHAAFSRSLAAMQEARTEQLRLMEEINRAQRHLVQSEKMAGIGQLAAGVAHEINNPVGYVFSNLRSLANYVHDLIRIVDAVDTVDDIEDLRHLKMALDYAFIRDDVEALISESEEGINRVKNIITALQDFSHVDHGGFRLADLHRGIDTTLNVAANELKYKADVVKEYGDLPQIECNISQLNQMVLNLLVNAAQAIEGRGTITIRTGVAGTDVWLEIEDTGSGMSPELAEKIFEPFFTTKPVGRGTGLGLALSYGIVQQHKGHIEVRSEAGKGSCFRVTLPMVQQASAAAEEETDKT